MPEPPTPPPSNEHVQRAVFGYTENLRHALVVTTAPGHLNGPTVAIHAVDDGRVSVFGRWECSLAHLMTYAEEYRRQYPVQPEAVTVQ